MTKQDHKTKDFLERIDFLIDRGIIKNDAEIITTLNWNKSVMSSVRNGKLPVPQHIYNKFREIYSEHLTKNPDLGDQDFQAKYIALLESSLKEKTDLLQKVEASLKGIPADMALLTDLIMKGQDSLLRKINEGLDQKLKGFAQKTAPDVSGGSRKRP